MAAQLCWPREPSETAGHTGASAASNCPGSTRPRGSAGGKGRLRSYRGDIIARHARRGGNRMEPRLSLVTLGVQDLERSTRFYVEVLGLPQLPTPPGIAF